MCVPIIEEFHMRSQNWGVIICLLRQVSNGVKPVIPFTDEELEKKRMGSGEVEVGFCPFIGMSVPGTCIVEILSKERVSFTGW